MVLSAAFGQGVEVGVRKICHHGRRQHRSRLALFRNGCPLVGVEKQESDGKKEDTRGQQDLVSWLGTGLCGGQHVPLLRSHASCEVPGARRLDTRVPTRASPPSNSAQVCASGTVGTKDRVQSVPLLDAIE